VLRKLCDWCDGSGKDEDAERAASPGKCPYCGGSGFELTEPEDGLCEHGKYDCQTCEIKLLKQVIAECEEEKKELCNNLIAADSLLSLLHHRGYIDYSKKGAPAREEVARWIGSIRKAYERSNLGLILDTEAK